MVDGDWPFRRIDHVLVRCGPHGGPTLAVRECARVLDEPVGGVQASDHYGLIADLEPRRPRPSPRRAVTESNLGGIGDLAGIVG
ncbi:hypothetical protein [Actinomadura opuntiae]|uniref:hypothetical protein n=1 Tax=Actinomadura sp. OS1-43 TaxID=604315 RepID=UPI00255B118E|nr:hypothetical protein [Actinomadura sp. OS1-43]MDL4816648.1 hypothetical protein [Actinomadura sp. OS1-43]